MEVPRCLMFLLILFTAVNAGHGGQGRPRAALIALASDNDIDGMVSSMRDIEIGFNSAHEYDWCFFSTAELSVSFKEAVSNATPAVCTFDVIPASHWSMPGKSCEGPDVAVHHHQARWHAGLFARESRLKFYDFFWKVQAGSRYTFDFKFDPFRAMRDSNRIYGRNKMDLGDVDASKSLYQTATQFMKENPTIVELTADISWVLDPKKDELVKQYALETPESTQIVMSEAAALGRQDDTESFELGFSRRKQHQAPFQSAIRADKQTCPTSGPLEMGSLAFFRGPSFSRFFDHLDADGTFYYNHLGRSPVSPLSAALLAPGALWLLDDDASCRAGTTTVYDTPPPVDPSYEVPFLASLICGDYFAWTARYLAGLDDYSMLWRQYWGLLARDFNQQAVGFKQHQGFTHKGDIGNKALTFLNETL
ncbi:hypothetical protein BN1723_015415 [Verticillium longisporum]|uniref:Glycolipid 2-alpha-mannosyltransferase n=1 Tax=Verticillium longisporum TaxID=100787 RepID=A0A0G4MXA3_VERLO|nr:hypothetical protein BN1723_015415 [Verticillium longisporum]CRK40916.1 hypothetical protein BN1708_008369 [Verticillium longisporum]